MPDSDEETGKVKAGLLSCLRVLEFNRLDGLVTENIDDSAVPDHFDLVVGEHPILHGLRSPQRITAVNHVDLGSKLGEV